MILLARASVGWEAERKLRNILRGDGRGGEVHAPYASKAVGSVLIWPLAAAIPLGFQVVGSTIFADQNNAFAFGEVTRIDEACKFVVARNTFPVSDVAVKPGSRFPRFQVFPHLVWNLDRFVAEVHPLINIIDLQFCGLIGEEAPTLYSRSNLLLHPSNRDYEEKPRPNPKYETGQARI